MLKAKETAETVVYIPDTLSGRSTARVYRPNPFVGWEYWSATGGWKRSDVYALTPMNATGHKIVRRGCKKIVSYESTWAEPTLVPVEYQV